MKVILNSGKVLSELTEEEMIKIKSDLTFENPLYVKAKRYSKYPVTRIPEYLFYYDEIDSNTLRVPMGYKVEERLCEEIYDERHAFTVDFPEFVLDLREEQKKAADSYLCQYRNLFEEDDCDSITDMNKDNMICLPTGSGKTQLALFIASQLEVKTIVLVHKLDLLTSWKKDIKKAFNGKLIPGIIQGQNRKIGDQITLATYQTIDRMSTEERETLFKTFSLLVNDEAHRIGSNTFSLIDKFNSLFKLGLSATPERSDGLTKVLQLFLGGFAYKHVNSMFEKDILPVKVIRKEVPYHYTPSFRRVKGGYEVIEDWEQEGILITDINTEDRPPGISHHLDSVATSFLSMFLVKDIKAEYEKGHSCIVFFLQKKSCYRLQTLLESRNIDCIVINGDNSNKENEALLEKASNQRKLVTITTYSKSTEGTNVPQWEIAFLASSINDGKNTEQAIGRIRRKMNPDQKINPVLVYDYRYNGVYALKHHGKTRDSRYRMLKLIVENSKSEKIFGIGLDISDGIDVANKI